MAGNACQSGNERDTLGGDVPPLGDRRVRDAESLGQNDRAPGFRHRSLNRIVSRAFAFHPQQGNLRLP